MKEAKSNGGVLVDRQIHGFIKDGSIKVDPGFVQPGSLDLPLGAKVWEATSQPTMAGGFDAAEYVEHYCVNPHDLDKDGSLVLFPGKTYFCELEAELRLPEKIYGYTSAKSSSGRMDFRILQVADGATQYNVIPSGYSGKLYMTITSRSFHVVLHKRLPLIQIRLFDGPRYFLNEKELLELQASVKVVPNEGTPDICPEGLVLHLDLAGSPSNLVARRYGKPVDLHLRGQEGERYFEEKALDSRGRLILEPDEFVLAATKEGLAIPVDHCGEMVAWTERLGPFEAHFAGFFDPGFGLDAASGQGNRGVLEIRNNSGSALQLADNQEICVLRMERLAGMPEERYGHLKKVVEKTHYAVQSGVKWAKYFDPGAPGS